MGIFFFFNFSIVSLLSNVFIWGLYFYFFAFLYILYESIYETCENSEYSFYCWLGRKQLKEELHWHFGSSASYMVCTRCMCEGGFFFLSVVKQDGNVWSFCHADSGAGDRDADGQTTKDWRRDLDFVIWGLMEHMTDILLLLLLSLQTFGDVSLPSWTWTDSEFKLFPRPNYQTKCATLKLNTIRHEMQTYICVDIKCV